MIIIYGLLSSIPGTIWAQARLIDGKQSKDTMDRRVSPKPMPEGAMRALHWIADHAREYKGQWVAIDGDRLIAHGANADEVFDAAEADGCAYRKSNPTFSRLHLQDLPLILLTHF
ncbi:MAG TPA: DUF5678 domain-containing protein [Blastocatellia bacterium]|nr:DUF5678 domain-containing protein [Blastocatellia bacterium]